MRKLLFFILIATVLASCSSERRFVRFHDKNDSKAAKHCAVWYPVKDSIHERITYRTGKPIILPGETKYANCDSAYIAALDEAARTGKRIVVQRVAVPCPPSTITHDTVYNEKVVYSENTALVTAQAADIAVYKTGFYKWRSRAIWAGVALIIVLLGLIVLGYYRFKSSFLRK